MLNLKKVAITGGIAAGKSTVCHVFQEIGAQADDVYVIFADQIVNDLYSKNQSYKKKVISLLGDRIIQDGEIDKKKVAELVFSSEETLKKLEEITHPQVLHEIQKQYEKAKESEKYRLFIAEIPLLFEIHDEKHYDVVILVTADDELSKKRFLEKGFSSDDFEKRKSRLMNLSQKAKKADYIIENNGTLDELRAKVQTLYRSLSIFQ